MTAANWIALIVPIVGLVGGALIYVLQKQIDRENEVRRERRDLYRRAAVLLEHVNQAMRSNDPDTAEQLNAIKQLEVIIAEVQVACPDPVAEAWANIPMLVSSLQRHQQYALPTKTDLRDFEDAIIAYETGRATALQAMRRDTYGETKITFEKLKEILSEMASMYGKLLT